ncbi:MAG: alpha/beta fold hydrolase [Thermodesulfobacteriota bacterium]
MPEIRIDGLKVNYFSIGDFNRSVPTVLLIHGACQSSWCWKFQIPFLKNYKKFNSIAIDLPGHGLSEGDGLTSISEYSDFISKFIENLDLIDVILLGHSMGGRISQVLILDHPENVIGCILAGTGARLRVTQATFRAIEKGFEYFAKTASINSFSENASIELREEFYNHLINSNNVCCKNDMIACNEFDVRDDISNIYLPALIICGENDILAPVKYSKYLYESIKGSTIKIIKNSGHFMMLEKPGEFNSLLKKFLDII